MINDEYFSYDIEIGFNEPWIGAFVRGKRRLGADNERDMVDTVRRYDAYYKDTYGENAYCRVLEVFKD